jgi:hypothetical protein
VTAYANRDDVFATYRTKPNEGLPGTSDLVVRLESLLETSTAELIRELGGVDFFRHPTTGSATWLADGDGTPLLHVHRGIVALEKVEISIDYGLSFLELDPASYVLQWGAYGSEPPPDGEPWFHLRLLPYVSYPVFPRGTGLVRLTGASGWPAIPRGAVEGVAERARQVAMAGSSLEGSPPADPEFGTPSVYARWPDITWKLIKAERRRFYGCEL